VGNFIPGFLGILSPGVTMVLLPSFGVTNPYYVETAKEQPLKIHPYIYVQNRPINLTDPLGLSDDECKKEKCRDRAKDKLEYCIVITTVAIELPAAIGIVGCVLGAGPAWLACSAGVLFVLEPVTVIAIYACVDEYFRDVDKCPK
jgi:hypothetical protein